MESLFDNAALLARWRLNWQRRYTAPPPWPETAQAWLDQRLLAKRLLAKRLSARQWLAAFRARRRAVEIAQSRWYRRSRAVYVKAF